MNIFPEARLDSPTPTQIDLQYKKKQFKKTQQILRFKRLEQENIWCFCLKNYWSLNLLSKQ